jgi:beta-mannanase
MACRKLDIVMWYQDWVRTRTFDPALLRQVRQRGATPMLTWEPWDHLGGRRQPDFRLGRLLAGAHDAHIRAAAQVLRDHGEPVLLRWAHEMNSDWYPWGKASGGRIAVDYREAWLRVWSIFHDEGATNVRWVWSPNIVDGAAAFEAFYPGDRYVDWVGLDGYNWGGRRWKSFTRLFAESYDRLVRLTSKPVMVAETACAEGAGKAEWIRQALEQEIPQRFARIHAIVWFNQRKERDWRIDSSPESRKAFAAAVSALENPASTPPTMSG